VKRAKYEALQHVIYLILLSLSPHQVQISPQHPAHKYRQLYLMWRTDRKQQSSLCYFNLYTSRQQTGRHYFLRWRRASTARSKSALYLN